MSDALPNCTIEVRVRYSECDPMGYVHHSVYPVWFEQARTELLREHGYQYAQLHNDGLLLVVARMGISYRSPGRYDDHLTVTATLKRAAGAKIEHDYRVHRNDELLCTAWTVLACCDQHGHPHRVPDFLQL